jgi:hypothetical protein
VSVRACATCIAVWLLFFYYLPAQSEPDMQDDVWYDMCITVSGKDGKWLWRQMMEHGIKIGTPPRPRSQ